MKIIHPSGSPYELPVDFKMEITRTNPFFHKTGEQSLPCSLPASDNNLALLNQPANIGNSRKTPSRLDVTIENGPFFMKARQAILSAQGRNPIETSFYLNEGAFYEKTKNLSLLEIFKNKTVDFGSVDNAITFMQSLLSVTDERFACFSVITDERELNAIYYGTNPYFVNTNDRTEKINDKQVFIPKGMFITPFVKFRHILSEVATHIGYSLSESFLDESPFRDMVFLNNNTDTIVTGRIDYVDIVPDLSVSELFDIIRKFNCEIIPDEINKKLRIIHFDSILEKSPINLTSVLTDDLKITYHHNYKQLKLTSAKLKVPEGITPFGSSTPRSFGVIRDSIENISELVLKYPTAKISHLDGSVYRTAYKGNFSFNEILGTLHCDYFAGDIVETEEKQFPDTLVDVYLYTWHNSNVLYPYVGKGRSLRTKMVFDSDNENEAIESTEIQKLPAMLCFYYHDGVRKYNIGTIYNRDGYGTKLWDYTLTYNGADGVFERFWRKYDTLLRNALLSITGRLLLNESQKVMLPSYGKIQIDGQDFLPSEIKYIPGDTSPQECSFFTTKLQSPISIAPGEEFYFPTALYKWILKFTKSNTTYPDMNYKSEPVAFFPPSPTQQQYSAGGRYYEKIYNVEFGQKDPRSGVFTKKIDGTLTVWLEPALA